MQRRPHTSAFPAMIAAISGTLIPVSLAFCVPPNEAPTAVIDGKEVPAPDIKMGDAATIARILDEGKNRNQVMQRMDYLTHEIGPRLTGSSNAEKANNWCKDEYTSWGLSNPHLEQWGEIPVRFDRLASTGKVTAPEARDIEFTWSSWSAGTDGPVKGKVIKEPETEEQADALISDAKGAWILAKAPPPRGTLDAGRQQRGEGIDDTKKAIRKKLTDAGAAGFITPSSVPHDLVITSGARGWRELDFDNLSKEVSIRIRRSDYDFINSRIADGVPVEVEFNCACKMTKGPVPTYNTIAEIPGTTWPDQVVIISGHLDSWDGPGSQGCTDNGTGTVVTLEAARILMAAHAKPKRTIRFINWTGEEQGLLGSKAYVKAHEAEMPNISACFVDDGGTNPESGLPAAENMVPMLAAATAPVNGVFYSDTDKKFLNVNIRNTGKKIATHGASDHASFNKVGVPGFFWDEGGRADYNHTHHTQYDSFDAAIPEYLVQSSTCAAITAYNLACADDLLPRQAKDADEEPKKDAGVVGTPPGAPAVDSPKPKPDQLKP
jgi:carboxypeptidase Q